MPKKATMRPIYIHVPMPLVPDFHVPRVAVLISDYDGWTPSDFAYEYRNANKLRYSWDNAVPVRRSQRLALIGRKNYKL